MPIIDVHAYLGAPPESVRPGTFNEVARVLSAAHIDAAMLVSGRGATGDFCRGNERVQAAIAGRANVYGIATINPSYPTESIDELRKRLSHPTFKGIKVPRTYAGTRINSAGLRAILNAARRFGAPVLVETTNEDDVRSVTELAAEFHLLKFVLGMGEAQWEAAIGLCGQVLNTVLEIGSLQADSDKVADALAAVGPRRIVFGSHFPQLHPLYVLGMVRDAALEKSVRDQILYRNALNLFGLELKDAPLGQSTKSESGS